MHNNPFIRASKNTIEGQTLLSMFRLCPYHGEVGLEVEVEGNRFPKSEQEIYDPESDEYTFTESSDLIPERWVYTHDGSLRGEDNAEYILAKPTNLSEVPQAIDELWEMFEEYGSVLDESNRTSVHVHLNAQQWHLNRVCAFFGLYFIVEDILTHWCGDHRVGNLFCLRAKDAPGIVARLKRFFTTESAHYLDDGMHYSGLNALSLRTLGSIEVRTMRGVKDPETIKTWVGILSRIYHMSAEYEDPREVVQGFSGRSRESFFESILGPYAAEVLESCGMTREEVTASLNEGVRIAQNLCYCRNWSAYVKLDCSPDPFGRTPQQAGPEPTEVTGVAVPPPISWPGEAELAEIIQNSAAADPHAWLAVFQGENIDDPSF